MFTVYLFYAAVYECVVLVLHGIQLDMLSTVDDHHDCHGGISD